VAEEISRLEADVREGFTRFRDRVGRQIESLHISIAGQHEPREPSASASDFGDRPRWTLPQRQPVERALDLFAARALVGVQLCGGHVRPETIVVPTLGRQVGFYHPRRWLHRSPELVVAGRGRCCTS
jgi:hypothetical protein